MKKAFTMIELLVVMVVGAILSAIAISKIQVSDLSDAAKSVVDDIRYARLLAIGDDVYREAGDVIVDSYIAYYYRIEFSKNDYKIYKYPSTSLLEYAKDYLDPTKIIKLDSSPRANVKKAFDITISKFEAKVPPKDKRDIIIFNEFGEPLNYNQEPSDFTIELSKNSEKICIKVEKLTGYAYIDKTCAP